MQRSTYWLAQALRAMAKLVSAYAIQASVEVKSSRQIASRTGRRIYEIMLVP